MSFHYEGKTKIRKSVNQSMIRRCREFTSTEYREGSLYTNSATLDRSFQLCHLCQREECHSESFSIQMVSFVAHDHFHNCKKSCTQTSNPEESAQLLFSIRSKGRRIANNKMDRPKPPGNRITDDDGSG